MANIFNYFCVNCVLLFVLFSTSPIIADGRVQHDNFENLYNKIECLNEYYRNIKTSREALNILSQLKLDVEMTTKSYVMMPTHLENLNIYFKKNGVYLDEKHIKILKKVILKKTEFKKKMSAYEACYSCLELSKNYNLCSIESDIKKVPEEITIGVSLALCGSILNSIPDETFQLVGFTLLTYGTQMVFEGVTNY